MSEVRDITEVMAEKLVKEIFTHKLPPLGLSTKIATALQDYGAQLTSAATKQIVIMNFELQGYKDTSDNLWKLLANLNKLRAHYNTCIGNQEQVDPKHILNDLDKVFNTLGIKVEGQEDATS